MAWASAGFCGAAKATAKRATRTTTNFILIFFAGFFFSTCCLLNNQLICDVDSTRPLALYTKKKLTDHWVGRHIKHVVNAVQLLHLAFYFCFKHFTIDQENRYGLNQISFVDFRACTLLFFIKFLYQWNILLRVKENHTKQQRMNINWTTVYCIHTYNCQVMIFGQMVMCVYGRLCAFTPRNFFFF